MPSITLHVTLPKNKFADKKWRSELKKAMKITGRDLKGLFSKTTFGWSKKPDFRVSYSDINNAMFVTVTPEGPNAAIWELVNVGAKPHMIPNEFNKILKFKPGYKASTTPGSLMSRRKARSGNFVFAKYVSHPGFEARRFTETIAETYEEQFGENTQDALNIAARSK